MAHSPFYHPGQSPVRALPQVQIHKAENKRQPAQREADCSPQTKESQLPRRHALKSTAGASHRAPACTPALLSPAQPRPLDASEPQSGQVSEGSTVSRV